MCKHKPLQDAHVWSVNLRWRYDTMVRVVGPYNASSLVESVHVGSRHAC